MRLCFSSSMPALTQTSVYMTSASFTPLDGSWSTLTLPLLALTFSRSSWLGLYWGASGHTTATFIPMLVHPMTVDAAVLQPPSPT